MKEQQSVEAYGVRGLKSTPWRKTFKDCNALNAWIERNNAEVLGISSDSIDNLQ